MSETTGAGLTTDEKFERLLAVLAAGSMDTDKLREILAETSAATAKAMQKAMKPENATHPGISVFSHPEGDVARPRVTLPYELYWNGYPVHKFPETEHWRELEMLALVQPGEYTVLRKDGSRMNVSAKAEHNADGGITKLSVEFKVARDEKDRVPPKTVIIHQMLNQDNLRKAFVEAMQEHLDLVMGAAV